MRTYGNFGAAGCPSGGVINRTTSISSNGAGVTHDGTSVYVQRTGYYAIMASSYTGDNLWDTGRVMRMHIITSGGNANSGNHVAAPTGGGGNAVQYLFVLLSAGHQVYFQTYQNSGYTANFDAGFWDLIFIPTSSYP